MKKILSITGFVLLFVNSVRSQSVQSVKTEVPLVNQLCPDFIFDTLINYKSEKLALSELKGKFVIIDFWGTFCIPCINAIPKMEALQKKFGDNLQVLMVAIDGFQKANQFYETRQKISKPMFLPSAISRKFFKYFQIKELPSYVWIDDQGFIKAITDESQVTDQNVADFINRKNVQFRSKEKEVIIDSKKYLLTIASEMDSGNVIYSSSLTKHLKGVSPTYFHPSRGGWTKVNARNMPIRSLYQIAFGDSVNLVPLNRTVIESAHPEKIACPKGEDYQVWKLDNSYCYELTVPKEKKHEILKMMRDELKKLFGYNVFQEYRTQKCLVLTAEKNPPIFADKNDTPKRATNMMGITVKNHPFSMLVESIQYYNQNIIVLDETGISGNIDVVLQAQPNDIDSLNEALKKYGLKLGYADRQVQMLVIKDPQ